MHVKQIILPRWILPIRPQGVVLEEHGIAIDEGVIKAIFPISQRDQFEAEETVLLNDSLVMPGLIDAHTHISMSFLRCAGSDLSTLDWLTKVIWPAEAALVSPEFVYQGALLGAAELLSGGVTTCHDMYFFASDAIRAVQELGMRMVSGGFVIKYPTKEYANETECIAGIYKLAKEFKDNPLVKINAAPHAPYSVTADGLQKAMLAAQDLGLTYQIHLSETQAEFDDAKRDFGMSPVQYLDSIGCLNERTVGVHSVVLEDQDIELMAQRGTSTVHCPVSNMRLGCGPSPIKALVDAGVNVALGTDGAASACSLNMFQEMRLTGMLSKGINRDPTALTCVQLLDMATINGAKALGLERDIGSIEPGKKADLIALDMSTINTLPILDIFSTVVYNTSREFVSRVWVNGELVVQKQQNIQKLPHIEAILLKSDLMSWQNRVCEILRGVSV